MIRFTQTDKWNDAWFRKLPPNHKLVFLFIIDNCNNAGFYELDNDHVAYITGLDIDSIEGAIKGLERGITRASEWVWVHNFLRHQKNEELNPSNPAHKQIISMLNEQRSRFSQNERFSQWIEKYKPLLSPIPRGTSNSKGQVKVKDKTPEKAKASSVDEVKEFCQSIGLLPSDAEWFWWKCEGNTWTNGGKPIKDWQMTLRSWLAAGYIPSRKNGAAPTPNSQLRSTLENVPGSDEDISEAFRAKIGL